MRKGIDGEGVVPEQHGAQAEAPDEEGPAANQENDRRENHWRHHVVFVEPAEFGEFGKVGYVIQASLVVAVRNDPADMRPEETKESRRMQVVFLVRIAMMVTVMRRPPKYAFLSGGHGHEGDDELKSAAGLE